MYTISEKMHNKTLTVEDITHKAMLASYRKLHRLVKPSMKEGDSVKLKQAFQIATESHDGAKYISKDIYHYHPVETAMTVAENIGLGVTSVICTLLHSAIKDIERSDVQKIWGLQVAQILNRLHKVDTITKSAENMTPQRINTIVATLAKDAHVVLIKIADTLQKMRSIDSFPAEQQVKIAEEANHIYIPIAHRLGLHNIKAEIETLHLKFDKPEVYYHIIAQLEGTSEVRERFIRRFKEPLKKILEKEGFDFIIKSRIKSIASIHNKMQKLDIDFSQVYDFFAIRIILDAPPSEEEDRCWQVHEVIHNRYRTNPEKFRDWLSTPKDNGYQALHMTVMGKEKKWVEIQIRSKRMDELAEKGGAAHWKYKEGSHSEQLTDLDPWLAQIRNILEKNEYGRKKLLDIG